MELTGEQRDLRDAVRGLLTRQHGAAPEPSDPGPGYDQALWQRLCGEIGVAGLAIPARYGGAGAGPVETHVVMEELGREPDPVPDARLGGPGRPGPAGIRRCRGVPAAAARHRRRHRDRGPGLDGREPATGIRGPRRRPAWPGSAPAQRPMA